MTARHFGISALSLTALCIYLFVSAPPQLHDDTASGEQITVERMFNILQAENAAVRALWTKEFVSAGGAAGLKFDEHWQDEGVDAGPLPALFLRDTAKVMIGTGSSLNLFLGSDFPISSANRFEGVQVSEFDKLKAENKPRFFTMADSGASVAMFPDIAVNKACVSCHNDHKDSPKKDWKLHDMMGATTWLYPRSQVSVEEVVRNLSNFRAAVRSTYVAYLEKTSTFARKPQVGNRWPRDGYYLPNADVFMSAIEKRNSESSLDSILSLLNKPAEDKNFKEAHRNNSPKKTEVTL